MYNIAIVSSENEMRRFAWADVRPMLKSRHFDDNYNFDIFSSQNIYDLVGFLEKDYYDSIIFTTNSCNETVTIDELRSKRFINAIDKFLSDGKGIFISLQMHIARDHVVSGFLPEIYEYKSIKTDNECDVKLLYNSRHIITHILEAVSLEDIELHCKTNQFVDSRYTAYIEPLSENKYETILCNDDSENNRPILMCSHGKNNRVVISTMVLDWQEHKALFCNIVKFITEGRPLISFLVKNCSQSAYFNYLKEVMWYKKIGFKEYNICDSLPLCQHGFIIGDHKQNSSFPNCESTINLIKSRIDFIGKHSIYITDPSWTESENQELWNKIKSSENVTHLIFFAKIANEETIIEFENYSDVAKMELDVCTWLHCQFNDDNGRWQDSFWATCDVIDLFFTLKKPLDPYKDSIIRGLQKNTKHNSYDGVVSATCALLKMIFNFYGKEHSLYVNILGWINSKIETASIIEKITIISTFRELVETMKNEQELINQSNQVLDTNFDNGLDNKNEIAILRNCKFYSCIEDYNRLKKWLVRLIILQNTSGAWMNVSRTGIIAIFLLHNRQIFIENMFYQDSVLKDLDYAIFHAISYIYAEYNKSTFNWNKDIPTTAVAIQALHEFDSIIKYPIDKIIDRVLGKKTDLSDYEAKIPVLESSLLSIRKKLSDQKELTIDEHNSKEKLSEKVDNLQNKINKYKGKTLFRIYVLVGLIALTLCALAFAEKTFSMMSMALSQTMLQPILFSTLLWDFLRNNVLAGVIGIILYAVLPIIGIAIYDIYKDRKKEKINKGSYDDILR
jgi:hypothetical protein